MYSAGDAEYHKKCHKLKHCMENLPRDDPIDTTMSNIRTGSKDLAIFFPKTTS